MIRIKDWLELAATLASDEGSSHVLPRHHHEAKVKLGVVLEINEEVVTTKVVTDVHTGERKLKHRVPDSKFTADKVLEIREYYEVNKPSLRALAKYFGCCLRTANQVILGTGAYRYIDLTYDRPPKKHCKYSKAQVDEIREYSKNNKKSVKAMAEHFECCPSTLARIIKKRGVYGRSPYVP